MSRTAQAIRQRLIAPAFDERPANLRGEILAYYPEHAKAQVKVVLPGSSQPSIIDGVPVRVPPSGLAEGAPRVGDGCFLSFYGDVSKMVITGFISDDRPQQLAARMNRQTSGGELPAAASRWDHLAVGEPTGGPYSGAGLGGLSFRV